MSSKSSWDLDKSAGNERYKAGDIDGAIICYSKAIDALQTSINREATTASQDLDQGVPDSPVKTKEQEDVEAQALAAAAVSGNVSLVHSLLSKPRSTGGQCAAVDAKSQALATLYSNRAQCHLQMKDPANAEKDCTRTLEIDPQHAKALVRRALAREQLYHFEDALTDIHTARQLSSLPTSLSKVLAEAKMRLSRMRDRDRQLLSECKEQLTLVHPSQTLRFHFTHAPQLGLTLQSTAPGNTLRGAVNVANEFGLWKPADFPDVCDSASAASQSLPVRARLIPLDAQSARWGQQLRWKVEQLASVDSSQPMARMEFIEALQSSEASLHLSSQGTLAFQLTVASQQLSPPANQKDTSSPIPSFFLEISPVYAGVGAESPRRPVLSVLSLPFEIAPHRDCHSSRLDGLRTVGPSVGAHSCRLTDVAGIEVFTAESPGHLGIGGKVWDSALVLCHYLRLHKDVFLAGKSVLELGAGTGLVGLACAKLGARHTFITDIPEVCDLIDVNLTLNGLSSDQAEACPLAWSTQIVIPDRILAGEVTTIVLSDVVYDPELYEPLLHTLSALYASIPTDTALRVLLAHRHRNPEDHKFFSGLENFGIELTEVDLSEVLHLVGTGKACEDVHIFDLSRRQK